MSALSSHVVADVRTGHHVRDVRGGVPVTQELAEQLA
jgi:hypothetical protein